MKQSCVNKDSIREVHDCLLPEQEEEALKSLHQLFSAHVLGVLEYGVLEYSSFSALLL